MHGQLTEKCGWGTDCPFCKNQEKEDDKHQQQQKMSPQPKLQKLQARQPKTLNVQTNIKYPSQTKIKQQWKAEMDRPNSKYNLDCFSVSELDSESDEDEQYRYEHGYETLI